jgi:hypothetical protein
MVASLADCGRDLGTANMANPVVKSLLTDAESLIRLGFNFRAHRLLCQAGRIAAADRCVPLERIRAINTARLAIAATF